MLIIVISRLKRRAMFCLRLLVVLAIFALLFQHMWAFVKGGLHRTPRDVTYHPASRTYDIMGEGKFLDRFLQFWRDYYYGRPGKKRET
ncbi:hypothetical protein [Desulfovirgula thermocuniculi]|uniref:hypothetical protein n=1 Tax=Desulfovirgula thermocuniculi TaxID=348842 RepID=UPI00041E8B7E|nr:hypothetical protein [Desulfovirgula thermocuniculi]